MKSRPARLTLSALAWIALGAAAFFVFQTQQRIDLRHVALRSFESSARDASDALDDVQAGQQAYVATGQNASEWTAKVSTFLQTAASSIDTLRATAQSGTAGAALLDASTAVTQVGNIDRRLHESLAADDVQSAADVVFSEAADAVSSAVSNIDAAIAAEQQAADGFEHQQRQAQVYALGGVAGLVAIILAMLGFAAPAARVESVRDAAESADRSDASAFAALAHEAVFDKTPIAPPLAEASAATAALSVESLRSVAGLCTEFSRIKDAAQLTLLLEQAANLLNARGLIVWLGSSTGADLRPVLAHGYSEVTLARIPTVARSADNAAAAAYRTGEVQIVKAKSGGSQGAIVTPLLAADGCIGALTAEIRDRAEESDATRALSLIVAAQLSGVLAAAATANSAPAAADPQPAATEPQSEAAEPQSAAG